MKIPLSLIAIISAGTLLAVSLGASTPWTVNEAVATALRDNPDAEAARQRISAAESMIEQADSAWLPHVGVSGRYLETNSPMQAFGSILNQRAFNYGIDFNHPGRIDDLNLTGTVGYNLYSGGQATANRNAARAGSRAAEQEMIAVQHQLAAEIVKAVLNLRKAREGVTALEAGAGAYEAAVSNARLRHAAGQMLKADLLSLEVQLAQTREQLSSARHAAALAARAFTYLLGSDHPGEPVELSAHDGTLESLQAPAETDLSHRPELLSLRERLQAAEARVEAARGSRRPSVNAFASYQYDQGWQLDRHADSWMAGVAVELNVFDGGQTSGKIRQASAELAQLKAQLRKATLGIGFEVEQARLAHADARERLTVNSGAVAQAEESAALSRARFEKGALLTAELIGSESRLIEARMRLTHATADERIALVELRRALGLSPVSHP